MLEQLKLNNLALAVQAEVASGPKAIRGIGSFFA